MIASLKRAVGYGIAKDPSKEGLNTAFGCRRRQKHVHGDLPSFGNEKLELAEPRRTSPPIQGN